MIRCKKRQIQLSDVLVCAGSRWTWIWCIYIHISSWLWLRVYPGHKIRRVPFCYSWAICCITIFLSIVILLILLILFHHRENHTWGIVNLLPPNLNQKLPLWMRTVFCRFYAYKYSFGWPCRRVKNAFNHNNNLM